MFILSLFISFFCAFFGYLINLKFIKCNTRRSSIDRLPSDVIFNIFSRVPAKCLARSRCVSKVWCSYIDDCYLKIIHDKRVVEEPTPILYHPNISRERICFHVIESKQPGNTHYVLKPKGGPYLEYIRKEPLSRSSKSKIQFHGSCNGLIILEDDGYVITSLTVVHPLRKECYELPPFPLRLCKYMHRESCGLGFDTSTNTLKMVCVLLKERARVNNPDMVKKNLCTMVHVFGTNSWHEIPQVPSYPISDKAVFANGCLHWLASRYSDIKTGDGGREVIWFDVNKEEFGLIERPKIMCDIWRKYSFNLDKLVDLNGEVGYVCTMTMEFWLLNHKKEWVPHGRLKDEIVPDGYIDVIGCWNKDGDILIKRSSGDPMYAFYVYNLKRDVLHKTNLAFLPPCPGIFMYPNTLSSIRSINANSFSMKTTDLVKSCRDLHRFFM